MGAYRLRFVISESDPEISRTVAVPDFSSFYDLHSIIQSVMGWKDHHFFAFESDGRRIAFESPYGSDRDAERPHLVPISEFEGKPVDYTYDYGYGLHVLISWEGREDIDGRIPVLIDWENDAPPEDCGSLEDFYDIVEAIDDLDSPDHNDAMMWNESIGFDEDTVLNSLETWGPQGVMPEGAEPLDPMVRILALASSAVIFDGSICYDRDEKTVAVIRGPETPPLGTDIIGNPIAEMTGEDLESEPDRYIPIWESIESFRAGVAERMCERMGWDEGARMPGESDLDYTDRIGGVVLERDVGDDLTKFYTAAMSEHTFQWAERNGFFFMSESVAVRLAKEDPERLRALGADPSDPASIEDLVRLMNPVFDDEDSLPDNLPVKGDDIAYMLTFTVRDSDPVINRTVAVPAYASFYDLHVLIQDLMQWNNDHLYSFDADGDIIEEPDPSSPVDDGVLPPICVPIAIYQGCPIDYRYDFGDDWHVDITWGDVIDEYYDNAADLILWNGNSPPEDCGGIRAYMERQEELEVEFDEDLVRRVIGSWGVQGIAGPDSEFVPEIFRIELTNALLAASEDTIVYDKEGCILATVRRNKRRSKRRDGEETATVTLDEISADPDRYIVVWDTPAAYMEDLITGFLEDRNIPETRRKGESVREFIGRADAALDDETRMDWRLHCAYAVADEVCEWAEDNDLYFYSFPNAFVSPLETVFRLLHDKGVDISDPEALQRFMDEYSESLKR